MFIRKLIKYFLNFIIGSILFVYNILKIIYFKKKIEASDTIIFQNKGGFGYTFTTPDIIRNFFRKQNITYILFYEPLRHNKYIKHFFDFNYILLNMCVSLSFSKKIYRFGEYEGSKFQIFSSILIKFLKLIKKSSSKIYSEIQIYNKLDNMNKKNHIFHQGWKDIYFYRIKKKKNEIRT